MLAQAAGTQEDRGMAGGAANSVEERIAPMLAMAGSLPADDEAWAFEFKWDGIRAIAYVDRDGTRFMSRNDNDLTGSFPVLQPRYGVGGSRAAVLDGEIVAFDEDGRPSFQRLQRRSSSPEGQPPIAYVVFDVLRLDGTWLLEMPYAERRETLERLDLEGVAGSWTVAPRFPGPGSDVLAATRSGGLEGVVAKRLDSRYLPGRRSPLWTKVKNVRTQQIVVGGWIPGEGHRSGRIGSLMMGIPDGSGGLAYVGQVGSGFGEEVLRGLAERLAPDIVDRSPFTSPVPTSVTRQATWLAPRVVGEVEFAEWTHAGRLRQPVWRGLRPDKSPAGVVREP
ncbi:MAG TPA: non-homologous end-joining DNA ligase [Acidimicrobiales bacterium]|nr:non-homologous end-joining DNA ligase [Acidimicrobiales bacterium]